jgi:hypothetical protein
MKPAAARPKPRAVVGCAAVSSVAEMVLAFVLLAGAGLLIRSFWQLQKVPLGFNPENVMTAAVSLPDGDDAAAAIARNANFYAQLVERASALPGARGVAAITPLPLGNSHWGTGFDITGRPTAPGGSRDQRSADRDAGLLLHDGHSDQKGAAISTSGTRVARPAS